MTGSLAGAWGVAVMVALAVQPSLACSAGPAASGRPGPVSQAPGLPAPAGGALLCGAGSAGPAEPDRTGAGGEPGQRPDPGCAGCPWPGPAPDAPVGPADLRARSLCEIIPWTHLISSCRLCSLSCRGGIFPTFFPFSPRILRLFSPYPAFENYFPKNAGFFIPKGLFGDGRGH